VGTHRYAFAGPRNQTARAQENQNRLEWIHHKVLVARPNALVYQLHGAPRDLDLPDGGIDNELHNLLGRIIELSESHARVWSAAVSRFVQDVWFHRGFVELVVLPARDFLDHADRLFSLAPIRHLDITDVGDDLVELFASEHLAHIRSLGLSSCALGDADIEVLANSNHLVELWWLSLSDNRIGLDGADALAKSSCLPNLKYVDFGANPVDPVEQFSHDSGFIVETWLPEEGEILERRHGHISWLHLGVDRPSQVRRDRFGPTP